MTDLALQAPIANQCQLTIADFRMAFGLTDQYDNLRYRLLKPTTTNTPSHRELRAPMISAESEFDAAEANAIRNACGLLYRATRSIRILINLSWEREVKERRQLLHEN